VPVELIHRYEPRGTALTVFRRRDPEVLVSGPAGTGKSRACIEKLHAMCLRNPGMRGLMVRKTMVSLTSTGLVTYREHVAKESLSIGEVEYYGGSMTEPAQYRYINGSKVMIGGMDKPEKVMSSEYDLIYVQEATELTIEDWDALNSRLRNGIVSFQQLLADCNPNMPTHWLKKRCDRGDTAMINSRHEDNPRLFELDGTMTDGGRAYMKRLDALTGVRKLRLRDGKWVAAEGLIYDGYDPEIHLIDNFVGHPPDSWDRIWGIDFGYTNPFVCQFWAIDPDGRLYLYREIYMTRRLVEDHCKQIARIVMKDPQQDIEADGPGAWHGQWREPRPIAVMADHDAEGRATFERHMGISTTAAHKAVTEGIQAVEGRLKVQPDGRPRLYLCRDAVVERDPELERAERPQCTIEEIVGYVWDIREGKPPGETPIKDDDHGMDTKRYVVAERDLGARPNVRWF
jgi:PBSX family phage terminase large subunit